MDSELVNRKSNELAKRSEWRLPAVRRPLTLEEARQLEPQCGLSLFYQGMQIITMELAKRRLESVESTTKAFLRGLDFHERLRPKNG